MGVGIGAGKNYTGPINGTCMQVHVVKIRFLLIKIGSRLEVSPPNLGDKLCTINYYNVLINCKLLAY